MRTSSIRRVVALSSALFLALVMGMGPAGSFASDRPSSRPAAGAKKCKKQRGATNAVRCKRSGRPAPRRSGQQGHRRAAEPAAPGATKFAYEVAPSDGGSPSDLFTVGGYSVAASCHSDPEGAVRLTLTQAASLPFIGVQNSSTSLDGGPPVSTVQHVDDSIVNGNPSYSLVAHAGKRSVGSGTANLVDQGSAAVTLQLGGVVSAVGEGRCVVSGYYL